MLATMGFFLKIVLNLAKWMMEAALFFHLNQDSLMSSASINCWHGDSIKKG